MGCVCVCVCVFVCACVCVCPINIFPAALCHECVKRSDHVTLPSLKWSYFSVQPIPRRHVPTEVSISLRKCVCVCVCESASFQPLFVCAAVSLH